MSSYIVLYFKFKEKKITKRKMKRNFSFPYDDFRCFSPRMKYKMKIQVSVVQFFTFKFYFTFYYYKLKEKNVPKNNKKLLKQKIYLKIIIVFEVQRENK